MNGLCGLCGRWPRVASEFDGEYCAFHTRLMRWWSDSYRTEYYELEGRWLVAFLSGISDRLRPTYVLETFYALRYGGPFDFWPWDAMARLICRVRDHEPYAVAEDNEEGEWILFRCRRCRGHASLERGRCSFKAFREHVTHDSIYCGFRALTRNITISMNA